MTDRQESIGDTLWVVGDDGSLRATFGEGEGAIHATAMGEIPGSGDGIAVRLVRWDRVILEERFADLVSAMDAVARVVEDEWEEDDRLSRDLEWVAAAGAAKDGQEVGVPENAESACAARALRAG